MAKKLGIRQCIMIPPEEYHRRDLNYIPIHSECFIAHQKFIHFLYDFGYLNEDKPYVLDYNPNKNGSVLFTIDFEKMYFLNADLKNYIEIKFDSNTLSLIEDLLV